MNEYENNIQYMSLESQRYTIEEDSNLSIYDIRWWKANKEQDDL